MAPCSGRRVRTSQEQVTLTCEAASHGVAAAAARSENMQRMIRRAAPGRAKSLNRPYRELQLLFIPYTPPAVVARHATTSSKSADSVYGLPWRTLSHLRFSQIRGRQAYSIVRKIPYLINASLENQATKLRE
jgi:hypothetical protein